MPLNRDAQHADEAHPRIACDVCEGEFFDQEDLAVHYLSSRKHPKCEKCGIGFRDQFDYTDVSDKIHHWFPFTSDHAAWRFHTSGVSLSSVPMAL